MLKCDFQSPVPAPMEGARGLSPGKPSVSSWLLALRMQ